MQQVTGRLLTRFSDGHYIQTFARFLLLLQPGDIVIRVKKVTTSICIARIVYKTPLTRIYVTETGPPDRYLGHRTACKHRPAQWPNNRPQAAPASSRSPPSQFIINGLLLRGLYSGPCAWAPFESEKIVLVFNVKKNMLKFEQFWRCSLHLKCTPGLPPFSDFWIQIYRVSSLVSSFVNIGWAKCLENGWGQRLSSNGPPTGNRVLDPAKAQKSGPCKNCNGFNWQLINALIQSNRAMGT